MDRNRNLLSSLDGIQAGPQIRANCKLMSDATCEMRDKLRSDFRGAGQGVPGAVQTPACEETRSTNHSLYCSFEYNSYTDEPLRSLHKKH